MRKVSLTAIGCIWMVVSLSGCALLQALSASSNEHPASHVPAGKVDVWLVRNGNAEEAKAMQESLGVELTDTLIENQDWCYNSVPKEEMKLMIAPLAGAALTAVAGAVIGLVGNEIAGYVEKQTKTFTSTFGTAVNHERLFAKYEKDGLRLDFDCIVVRQTTKEKAAPGFDFAALLVPSKKIVPEGYTLVPVFYRMSRSSARTGVTGDLDVTVAITISAVQSEASGKKFVTLADRTIVLTEVSLPKPNEKKEVPPKGDEKRAKDKDGDKGRLGAVNASAWFALSSAADGDVCMKDNACFGIMPVSVAVKITEVGTGSPDYGLASKEAGDLAKTISDGIGKIINSVTSK